MQYMRVLLVSANRTAVNMPVFPLGPAFLAAGLEKEGHQVRVLDLFDTRFPDPVEATAEAVGAIRNPIEATAEAVRATTKAVLDFRPQLTGFSVRNIDNQDPFSPEFYLPEVRPVISACREISGSPVVIGGAGFSIFPRAALAYLGGDFGVAGEGERPLCLLARALESGRDPRRIPCLITSGEPVTSIRHPEGSAGPATGSFLDGIIDENTETAADSSPGEENTGALGHLPRPALELFDIPRYGQSGFIPVQSKRGCSKRCLYCSSPIIEGRTIRLRPATTVVDEIEFTVKQYGQRTFFFVDSLFNVPEAHALELCREIIRRKLDINWYGIIHPVNVSPALAAGMKEAGCSQISLGFESGSDRMLKVLHKGFCADDIIRTAALFRQHEIPQRGFLLLGGPGEDRTSVDESIALAERLDLESMKVTPGMRIYPGTGLAEIAAAENVISREDDLLQPVFYVSEAVRGWLNERVLKECAGHRGWST